MYESTESAFCSLAVNRTVLNASQACQTRLLKASFDTPSSSGIWFRTCGTARGSARAFMRFLHLVTKAVYLQVMQVDGLMAFLTRALRFARKPLRKQIAILQGYAIDRPQAFVTLARHRLTRLNPPGGNVGSTSTIYVVGLFGSGRLYLNDVICDHIGERARYFRDGLLHDPTPTSMIYSGHMTLRHLATEVNPPQFANRIVASVRSGAGKMIFIYRHPLDSLLTNWVWWRSYVRATAGGPELGGFISNSFRSPDELCETVEREWASFEAFAMGDPAFFADLPGARFLSFAEFVEESVLLFEQATLRLPFEAFMTNPYAAFLKVIDVISPEMRLSYTMHIRRPRSQPGTHLLVMKNVPRFNEFVSSISPETKRLMLKLGYRN